jgi:hypothetical protein
LYVSRNIVDVDYPSEPILSIAAELLLEDEKSFSLALGDLLHHSYRRSVEEGNIEELVARIILLRCMSKLRNPDSQSVSVKEFLNMLAPNSGSTFSHFFLI